MASRERKKFQKRKQREANNHQAVLKRREKLRATTKEEREDLKRADRIRRLQRDLDRFDQFMETEQLAVVSDATLTQLEKNIKILKALEIEHAHEVNQRNELNQKMKAQGLVTLDDKMKAASQELIASQRAASQEFIAAQEAAALEGIFENAHVGFAPTTADSRLSVKKPRPKREIAEVSVVKAPVNGEHLTE